MTSGDSSSATLRAQARMVRSMLALSSGTRPVATAIVLALEVAQGLLPLATAWIAKILFDLLGQSLSGEGEPVALASVAWVVALQAAILLIGQALTPLAAYFQAEMARGVSLRVQEMVYRKVNGFYGLAYFEDPRFHDILRLAQQGAEQRPLEALNVLTTLLRSLATLLGFTGALLALSPVLVLVVAVAAVPQLLVELRIGRQRFALAQENSPVERRLLTYRLALSLDRFAKELRLFGLGEYFLRALLGLQRRLQETQRTQQRRHLILGTLPGALASLVSAGAFLFVVTQAFARRLTLGDVTLYTAAVSQMQSSVRSLLRGLAQLHESCLFFAQFERLLAMPQPLAVAATPAPVPPLERGIAFRNVSFRYGDDRPWVLRNLDLELPAGSCTALVGLNGAGKTTLVKLLTRLYDPTGGEILWDGVDLRDFDPAELRTRIGAVFQDFARYDLSARENIGVGDLAAIDDLERIREAAVHAGVAEVIERLPNGYETFLNRWLADGEAGAELSGGEWQKVAIARLFLRRAKLLILDEPTAALDARAESELYDHFVELMTGRTTLLISHRFTTVRVADRIAVLDGGSIREEGTHRELMALGGSYADLYRRQMRHLLQEPETPTEAAPRLKRHRRAGA